MNQTCFFQNSRFHFIQLKYFVRLPAYHVYGKNFCASRKKIAIITGTIFRVTHKNANW